MSETAHKFDPSILREYDIRGIVGRGLTADDAFAIGRVFASMVARAGGVGVTVGYDGRLTIEAFGRALPPLAAATRVWRDFAPSPNEVYGEGFKLIRDGWRAA